MAASGWAKSILLNAGGITLFHCFIKIVSREKKRFADLDDENARRDGFSSVLELKEALRKCYAETSDETEVFIYRFKLLKTDLKLG